MLTQTTDLRPNAHPNQVSSLSANRLLISLLTRFAVACLYVRLSGIGKRLQDYYRAIYLTERTVRDFMRQISEKVHVDLTRISSIMHVNDKGLRVVVDDDVVRELPEGQDMIVDISEAQGPDGSSPSTPGSPVEIKLTY